MIAVVTYGLRIVLDVADRRLLADVLDRLPPGTVRTRSTRVERVYTVVARHGGLAVTVNGAPLASGAADYVLDRFEADVKLYVSEMAHDRVFVHAGVVGWRGRAVVIPGRTMSGKSTLVAALVRAGARYYSDEYAVLDAAGRVHPYARPLALRGPGTLQQSRHAVVTLGGRAGKRPLRIALGVSTQFRRGAVWRPHRLTTGQGALRLLANTVAAQSDSERALTAVRLAVANAVFLESVRGDAGDTARILLDIVDQLPAVVG